MEFIRAKHEVRHALVISEPTPVGNVQNMWGSVGQAATVGIFLMLFVAFLYLGRAILLPVLAAAVIALTLAPLVKMLARAGISPWITGLFILLIGFGAMSLLGMALAGPVSNWISQAPQIGAAIQQKLSVLDQPLAALHQLEGSLFGNGAAQASVSAPNVVLPVVAFLTPAAGEALLFFVTLYFFLVGQMELRNQAVNMFINRDSKLRFLKIMHDIERNLAGYLTVVTIINAAVGTIVAAGAWLIGLPNPLIFGLLAALLNYVPYLGPAVMVVVLFGVGLVSFASLSHAFIAPLGLIAVTTTEGHLVTPTIVGRRLTLNPLLIFLALAFWTWMWGPFGSILAVPLSIVGLVIFNHLVPAEEVKLPD
ncbi:MAG TPA: AI-2E family transporter [Xanthobacteraceae bacterium]|nr:AI-2E family transporter [Xanthobacteraceae bacterium]